MKLDTARVMVVEDDVEMNTLQCELLSVYGIATVPAYTGIEALEARCCDQADAVLLDVMLPGMDGFETCRRLKQARRDLPVVLVTALDSEECRSRGKEAGADAYFTKPFDPKEVVDTIERLLSGSGDNNHSS